MGGVFHHLQTVSLRHGVQGRHVGGQSCVVHRHDGLGARIDGGLDRTRVDVQGEWVDVDQADIGAQVAHHFGRGGEGVGGGDDLVARADADGFKCQVQARGGRVDGQAMQGLAVHVVAAQEFGEVLLKAAGLGPGGDPAAAQRVHDFGDFVFTDVGQREGQKGLIGHGAQACVSEGGGASSGFSAQISTCVRSQGSALKRW